MQTGIYAVVQARRASTRFPDKVLADICGKPMIQRVLERVQTCELLEKIILATTERFEDKELMAIADRVGCYSFAGSENDVLKRFYDCTEGASTVVRVTGDCPLIDATLINGVLQFHLISDLLFTTNRPSYPDGLDIEVISRETLARAHFLADRPYDREHVTPYILARSDSARIGMFRYDRDLSSLHWSVDYPDDLEFIRRVYEILGEHFTFADLVASEGILWQSK